MSREERSSRILAAMACLAMACLALWFPGSSTAGEPSPSIVAGDRGPGPVAEGGLDFSELESTVDELFEAKMAEHRVSGGVIAVVYRGEVLLARGYGLADVEAGVPMDAGRTLLRLGSISKTVTAMTVMSLVDEGILTLDGDLRQELDVPVPARFDAPLTLRHLLTHTGGFENSDLGDAARDVGSVVPLREMVVRGMTAQSWPPGSVQVYSNHGLTLAGYAVEHAAGRPFDEVVATRIFEPLGMTRSSFAQPPPVELAGDLAKGHRAVDGGFQALPLDYSNVAPADALVATAEDVSRLLRALLRRDEAGGLLSPASLDEMMRVQHGYVESVPLSGLGLFFERHRGRWALAHTGGQLGFTSHLVLFPEEELGVFLALNTRVGWMRWQILQELLERYLPEVPAPPEPATIGPLPAAELARYTGTYRRVGHPRESLEKVMVLLGFVPESEVFATADGTLRIGGTELRALGNGRFWASDWRSELRFEAGPGGRAVRAYNRNVWERISWWERGPVHLATWALALAVFVSYLIAAGVRARQAGRADKAVRVGVAWPERAGQLVALVYTVSLAAFGVLAAGGGADLDYGLPIGVRLTLVGMNLGAMLTLVALPASLVMLRHPTRSPPARAHLLAVTLAAGLLTVSLVSWNLVA